MRTRNLSEDFRTYSHIVLDLPDQIGNELLIFLIHRLSPCGYPLGASIGEAVPT
jgi:hypothetical protein